MEVKKILAENGELNLNVGVNGRKILADALQAKSDDLLKTLLETLGLESDRICRSNSSIIKR